MSTEEFSNEFDVLIQSFTQNVKFGNTDSIAFTEYEKSVFLTKAQDDLVLSFYSGKNLYNDAFENTEEIRRYLSQLVVTTKIEEDKEESESLIKIHPNSHFFSLPKDLWFITYEALQLEE